MHLTLFISLQMHQTPAAKLPVNIEQKRRNQDLSSLPPETSENTDIPYGLPDAIKKKALYYVPLTVLRYPICTASSQARLQLVE